MKIFKTNLLIALLALQLCAVTVKAAENEEKPMKWVNALELRMINKGFDNSLTPYTRIPKYLKDSVRPTLWERSQCSS